MANVCKKICENNNCNVEVHQKMSTNGSINEINGRKNVLICETIGNYVLSEQIIPIINHAHDTFLEKNSIIIPKAAKLYGYLAESMVNYHLFKGTKNNICDINISYFTDLINKSHTVKKPISIDLTYKDQKRLSESQLLLILILQIK